MGGIEEQTSSINQVTQTFISHIVLEVLKSLYPNDFERIKSFDFNGLINFFKNAIPHLELPDLDPDNPFKSALALAKQHFDDPEYGLITQVDLGNKGHGAGLHDVLKNFFNSNNLGSVPSVDDVSNLLKEIDSAWHQIWNDDMQLQEMLLLISTSIYSLPSEGWQA